VRSVVRHLTASTLGAVAALHVAWGRGSSIPFADSDDLADAVVGRSPVPGPAACYAVASALVLAASVVEDVPQWPPALRRLGIAGVTVVLAARGVLGLGGMTDKISPGRSSVRFRSLDRRVYAPLCLALAGGAVLSRHRDADRTGG
jgi:hypothetical protein